MYGVVAQQTGGQSGLPPWLPDGALAHLDFVDGQYWADGAERAVSALLGGGFNAGDIVAGGMKVWESNSNRPLAIGVFKDVLEAGLAAGMTTVFEFTHSGGAMAGALLIFSDNLDVDSAVWLVESYTLDGANAAAKIADQDEIFLQGDYPDYSGTLTRVGLTFHRPLGGGSWRSAVSIDGGTAESTDTTYSGSENFPGGVVAKIGVGHIDEWSIAYVSALIRSITVYAAVDETALAALTEVPTA